MLASKSEISPADSSAMPTDGADKLAAEAKSAEAGMGKGILGTRSLTKAATSRCREIRMRLSNAASSKASAMAAAVR